MSSKRGNVMIVDRFILLALSACLLVMGAGCSLRVVPTPGASQTLDLKTNAISEQKHGLVVSVIPADAELAAYNLATTVSSFQVTISNQSDTAVSFDRDGFLLIDDQKRQYPPLSPEQVRELATKNSYYLLPYPYVGFYYLDDYDRARDYASRDPQLPYYEFYPQDIFTRALPDGEIIPKAAISGLLYFPIDLERVKNVTLQLYRKGTSKSSPPDFSFPFTIEH